MAIFDEIREIIADEVGESAESIKETSNVQADFNADSLTIVEIVMAIEDRYEVEIPEDQLGELTTVGDFVAYIERLLAEKK